LNRSDFHSDARPMPGIFPATTSAEKLYRAAFVQKLKLPDAESASSR
jgi:hypothetical protein